MQSRFSDKGFPQANGLSSQDRADDGGEQPLGRVV